jgi:hypothetical protein
VKFSDLRRVLDIVEPYRAGEYCLSAEHDELTIGLDRKPDNAVSAQLTAITGCALSWMSEDVPWDGELIVTCFT